MAIVVANLIPGIIIGIIIGFILQRGRFCFNSAIRDPLLLKDFKLIKGVGVAICVEMIGFAIIAFAGNTAFLSSRGLSWLAQIVGGTIFGMGMVLAAGCASGTTYRVGEGMMGSLVALIGLTLGVYLVKPGGLLNSTATAMGAVQPKTPVLIGGTTVAPILMIIIGILGLALLVVKEILPAIKAKKEKKEPVIDSSKLGEMVIKKPWNWWVAGIGIGIMAIVWLLVSGSLLGITGHWWNVGNSLILSSDVSMGGWMVIGIIVGAFISAKLAGEFKLRAPDGKTILIQLIGGVMMGVGAAFAGGCNIGNMLSGVAILSVGSILVTVFIIAGCWLMTYLMFMRGD